MKRNNMKIKAMQDHHHEKFELESKLSSWQAFQKKFAKTRGIIVNVNKMHLYIMILDPLVPLNFTQIK